MVRIRTSNNINKMSSLFGCPNSEMDGTTTDKVIGAFSGTKVKADDVVVRQGEKATAFHVIDHGSYNFYIREDDEPLSELGQLVDHVEESDYFGEYELIANKSHTATVIAVTMGLVWSLDQDSFKYVASLKMAMFADVIHACPLLDDLNETEKRLLCTALVPVRSKTAT